MLNSIAIIPCLVYCTGCVAQWLEYWLCGAVVRASDCKAIQLAARRFESHCSHSKGLKQAFHGTLFQSTQL